jgi:hypothetical protein
MSAEEEAADELCACCGKAGVDEIKLKKCACNLVKYCSVNVRKIIAQSTRENVRREWLK